MAVSELQTYYLDPSRWHEWDALVSKSTMGSIFQSSQYIRCVTGAFHRAVKIAVVSHNDRILGGAVLYPKQRLKIKFASTPYFIPYNGFVIDSFEESDYYYKRLSYQGKVMEQLAQMIEDQFVYCDLRQPLASEDLRILHWRKWQFMPDYTIVIPLDEEERLPARLDRDQRRRIRNFENNDFQIEELTDMAELYELMDNSYRKHSLKPPINRQRFVEFGNLLRQEKLSRCFAIRSNDVIQSALMVIEDFPDVFALFSGKSDMSEARDAELYLFWYVMNRYQKKQFKSFDLLGAMVPSIAKVKLELGGELKRTDHTRYFRNSIYRILFYFEVARKKSDRIL